MIIFKVGGYDPIIKKMGYDPVIKKGVSILL